MALFFPPLARGDRRGAPLDFARERQGGAADFRKGPAPLDAHVHVHAARSRRLRPADDAEVVERGTYHLSDRANLGPVDARHGIQIDAQFVGMIEIVGADRMRDAAPGTPDSPSSRAPRRRAGRLLPRYGRRGSSVRQRQSTAGATRVRASERRTRRRCHLDSGRGRWAGCRRRAERHRPRRGNNAPDRVWCSRPAGRGLSQGSRSQPIRPATSISSGSVRPTAAHYKGRRRNLAASTATGPLRPNRASPTCCVRRDAANRLVRRAIPWSAGEVETVRTSSIRSSPSVRPLRFRRTRYGDTPEVRGTAGRAEPGLAVQVHSSRLKAYADGFSVPRRPTVHQAPGHPRNFRAMNIETLFHALQWFVDIRI